MNALKPSAASLVVLFALVAGLAFSSEPALAAPPEAPAPVVVESVKGTSATFYGESNPGKEGEPGTYELGTYDFLYKKSSTECEGAASGPEVPGISLGGGQEVLPPQEVSGLEPHAEYTVCLLARNGKGEATVGPAVTFKTALPPATPTTEPASEITAASATLHGVLNPGSEGEAGSYEFLYRASATECEGGTASGGSALGHKEEAVTADVTVLLPNTQYTYCLLARNEVGETAVGSPVTFTTLAAAPTIDEESALNVASGSATLQAQINPGGAETTYHFEYGTVAGAYTVSVPVPNGTAGAGAVDVSVSAHVPGLLAGTLYHYRVVAKNELESVDGPDRTLETQSAVPASGLPDGREYELVSPVQKYGAEALGIGTPGAALIVAQASQDGGGITYGMKVPPELEAPATPLGSVNMLSKRGGNGWTTQDITAPYTEQPELENGTSNAFRVFSPDLSSSIIEEVLPANILSLSPQAARGVKRLPFLRDNTGYQPLATGVFPEGGEVLFEGVSPDLRHVVVRSKTHLLPSVTVEGESLYEWSGGHLQLVTVLPDGEQTGNGARLGHYEGHDTDHAISRDGSHVIFSVHEEEGVALYERDMDTDETIQVGEGRIEEFQTASSDGLKVFSIHEIGHGEAVSDLYEYDVAQNKINDLAPGGDVQGVLGASEDGSYVYFAGRGVLKDSEGHPLSNAEGKEPTTGAANLYMSREEDGNWVTRFITTLAPRDQADWSLSEGNDEHAGLGLKTARVSPNGQFVALMSEASLTGYNNVDADSGQRDVEVYLYDAGSDRLICASCDPTGARPDGVSDSVGFGEALALDTARAWEGHWLAAAIPGWTDVGEGSGYHVSYQSRYLSDEGRLFFDSTDALVPQDTNGVDDVYEYEPAGIGSCGLDGGCVGLISGGAGGQESSFVDASVSGDDVFFRTTDRLVSQDVDDAYDMYDAHVCSAEVPCSPPSVAVVPPCASSDACKPGPTPQPAVFGPPASATFSGSGNVVSLIAAPMVKAKSKEKKPSKRKRKRRRKTNGSGSHSKKGRR